MGKRGPRPTGKKSYVGLFAFDYPSELEDEAIQLLKQASPAKRTILAGNWYQAWLLQTAKEQTPND